jgi:hypothetical protein
MLHDIIVESERGMYWSDNKTIMVL